MKKSKGTGRRFWTLTSCMMLSLTIALTALGWSCHHRQIVLESDYVVYELTAYEEFVKSVITNPEKAKQYWIIGKVYWLKLNDEIAWLKKELALAKVKIESLEKK